MKPRDWPRAVPATLRRRAAGPQASLPQDLHPVLIRDCGFHTCHGSEERMFRVYGVGRSRLDEDARAFEENSVDEVLLSFDLTLSMIDSEHPERSPLLRKPLAIEAGGSPHDGVDDFGRNVYRTVDEDGYKAIRDLRRKTVELYDLKKDPGELDNLSDQVDAEHEEHLLLLSSFFAVHTYREGGYRVPYVK